MTYQAAEKLFNSKLVAQTAFLPFSITTLAQLCSAHNLPVKATGKRPTGSIKKSDYIDAIFSAVSLTYI
jgi:hypothetical protein